jgi:hypothetical protein
MFCAAGLGEESALRLAILGDKEVVDDEALMEWADAIGEVIVLHDEQLSCSTTTTTTRLRCW